LSCNYSFIFFLVHVGLIQNEPKDQGDEFLGGRSPAGPLLPIPRDNGPLRLQATNTIYTGMKFCGRALP
jgi:hypothetical protein